MREGREAGVKTRYTYLRWLVEGSFVDAPSRAAMQESERSTTAVMRTTS